MIFRKHACAVYMTMVSIFAGISLNLLAQSVPEKKNAAIFPFHYASTRVDEKEAMAELDGLFYDLFAGQLVSTDYFQIVDRRHIRETLEEIKLQQSGLTSGQVVEAGQILGAQLAIFGTVTKVGKESFLSLKIIDIETSLILKAVNVKGSLKKPDLLAMDAGMVFMKGLSQVLHDRYQLGTGQVKSDMRESLRLFFKARDLVQQAIVAKEAGKNSRAGKRLADAKSLLKQCITQSPELTQTVKLYWLDTPVLSEK